MIHLKPTVKLADLSPQILLAIVVADQQHPKRMDGGAWQTVVTSANDSKHRDGSLHYRGRAVDLRTKDIEHPVARRALIDGWIWRIKMALTKDFDVLLEGFGTDNEHLHLEYDPKETP